MLSLGAESESTGVTLPKLSRARPKEVLGMRRSSGIGWTGIQLRMLDPHKEYLGSHEVSSVYDQQ